MVATVSLVNRDAAPVRLSAVMAMLTCGCNDNPYGVSDAITPN